MCYIRCRGGNCGRGLRRHGSGRDWKMKIEVFGKVYEGWKVTTMGDSMMLEKEIEFTEKFSNAAAAAAVKKMMDAEEIPLNPYIEDSLIAATEKEGFPGKLFLVMPIDETWQIKSVPDSAEEAQMVQNVTNLLERVAGNILEVTKGIHDELFPNLPIPEELQELEEIFAKKLSAILIEQTVKTAQLFVPEDEFAETVKRMGKVTRN